MPTKRRRHAITETPRVERALAPLRELMDGDRLDLGELLVLGAEEKLMRLEAENTKSKAARRWLAERIRDDEPLVDPDLAAEVRRAGWSREG